VHVAFEHHDAIIVLVDHNGYGSAFAPMRFFFEAYVRGMWLLECASDVELDRFQQEKLDRTFGALIQDIEKLQGFSSGVLSTAKKQKWGLLNSFTHSGFAQAKTQRRRCRGELSRRGDRSGFEFCECFRRNEHGRVWDDCQKR